MTDPDRPEIETLRRLAERYRQRGAFRNLEAAEWAALAGVVEGVIERHTPTRVDMDKPALECLSCYADVWPCPDVTAWLAVAEGREQ